MKWKRKAKEEKDKDKHTERPTTICFLSSFPYLQLLLSSHEKIERQGGRERERAREHQTIYCSRIDNNVMQYSIIWQGYKSSSWILMEAGNWYSWPKWFCLASLANLIGGGRGAVTREVIPIQVNESVMHRHRISRSSSLCKVDIKRLQYSCLGGAECLFSEPKGPGVRKQG